MKKIFLSLLMLFTTQAWSAAEQTVATNSGPVTVRLNKLKGEMAKLEVLSGGARIQEKRALGDSFRQVEVDGKQKPFASVDLNGDGDEELIVHSHWTYTSGVEVYQWSRKEKKYVATANMYGDPMMVMASDAKVSVNKEKKTLSVKTKTGTKTYAWKGEFFQPL